MTAGAAPEALVAYERAGAEMDEDLVLAARRLSSAVAEVSASLLSCSSIGADLDRFARDALAHDRRTGRIGRRFCDADAAYPFDDWTGLEVAAKLIAFGVDDLVDASGDSRDRHGTRAHPRHQVGSLRRPRDDLHSAERDVAPALLHARDDVQRILDGSPQVPITADLHRATGVMLRRDGEVVGTAKVRGIIRRWHESPTGYRIVTAFPVP